MRILGIYGYSAKHPSLGARHNTCACFVVNGRIISVMEEERLTRIKNDTRYPHHAIHAVLEQAGEKPEHLAIVDAPRFSSLSDAINNHIIWMKGTDNWGQKVHFLLRSIDRLFPATKEKLMRLRSVPHAFSKLPKSEYLHHQAHAASAYYCCPWPNEKVLVITMDGVGDNLSGSVWVGEKGELRLLYSIPHPYSVGLIYTAWTCFLGFKPHRHEGKVLGLAAYGNGELLGNKLLADAECCNGHLKFSKDLLAITYGRFSQPVLERMAKGLSREDIAAGVQYFTEKLVLRFVEDWINNTGIHRLAVAGGVFSNVKLNQRLLELSNVENIYIHPNMGDGGLAVGACMLAEAATRGGLTPRFLESVYLGHQITDTEADAALRAAGLATVQTSNLAETVAELLATGKVVARAAGRMEYGPRALGNRSILAACSDPTINQWLNQRLHRTEFMPFAPIIMEEHAANYFPAWRRDHVAARFMTITYDAADIAKKNIPAAIHVDGTARPQVLRRDDNPDLYSILEAYHAKTGIPALINTSFNMHEEPIVCTADDAVRAFQLGHLDGLILGSRLIIAE